MSIVEDNPTGKPVRPASPHRQRGVPTHSRRLAGFCVLAATILSVAACGSGGKTSSTAVPTTTPAHPTSALTTWSLPGADLQNSRDVGGPINASNVSTLGVAWTVPITANGAFGTYATTPVVVDGVVYTQDLDSNVQAINLTSGKVIWTHKYNSPNVGPNGVTFASGNVYGATERAAFALRRRPGAAVVKKLIRNASEGIDMAPGIQRRHGLRLDRARQREHLLRRQRPGGSVGDGRLDGGGPVEVGRGPASLWSQAHKSINSGGGLWHPPTFDSQGHLYIGVAESGARSPARRSSRAVPAAPGRTYTRTRSSSWTPRPASSIWYYQLTPHDIHDWDLDNSPILATANGKADRDRRRQGGIVVAVDAQTGKLLWKRSVGMHNGHDNDGLLPSRAKSSSTSLQRLPGLPRWRRVPARLGRHDRVPRRQRHAHIQEPAVAPASHPVPFTKGTGEIVAIDEATGKIRVAPPLSSSPYGAATVSNDVVFTTTFDGTPVRSVRRPATAVEHEALGRHQRAGRRSPATRSSLQAASRAGPARRP